MKKLALCVLAAVWTLAQAGASQWQTDLPKALSQAQADKKLVLMDFNGSDWCPPCKALRSNVLNSQAFQSFADKNLVLVDVDFPRHKAQSEEQKKANQELAQKFNVEGFPTIIVLSPDGHVLDKSTGYGGDTPEQFISHLEQLKKKEAPVNYQK